MLEWILVGWLTSCDRLHTLVTALSFFLSEQVKENRSIFRSLNSYIPLLLSKTLSSVSHYYKELALDGLLQHPLKIDFK